MSLETITELGGCVWRDTQAWKGWDTLVWVDSAWAQTIAGVQLGSVFGEILRCSDLNPRGLSH